MENTRESLLGQKIIYIGNSNKRYGLKGEIIDTQGSPVKRVIVKFENGDREDYSISAFTGYKDRFEKYLALESEAPEINRNKFWLVVGNNTIDKKRHYKKEEANKVAEQKAAKSSCGERYFVCESTAYFERPNPPVEHYEVK